jgi:GH24 family phage-related lysozyme (muramidase)
MDHQEWSSEVERRITINEGRKSQMYFDTRGIPTVGVGFNLQRTDAPSILASIGTSLPTVMGGTVLSDAQIDKLFAYSLQPIEAQARASLQNDHYQSLSDARRFVICDLIFNLGEEGWTDFVTTRSLIDSACHFKIVGDATRAHDFFTQAADHLAQSAWYSQVGDRAKRDVAMMRSSDWVNAEGDGTY